MIVPFNKPYFTGNETKYIVDAVKSGKISGNGKFTKMCQSFFEEKYGFKKCLLTTSCTDALEMCAILLDIKPGDEVIVPSYTFVSTALAFVRQGAKIVFVDSRGDHPGINEDKIEELITSKTKVIVPVHYAGVACDMHKIMTLADKYGLYVVEDAAQAIDSFYIGRDGIKRALGSIGHLSAFSFHETKNIICGEGGMICINDEKFIKRAEIIWEKGTNRAEFFRGEVNKYGWVDIGSSFLPSEIISAFLWAQLENIDTIQNRRKHIWDIYFSSLIYLHENFGVSLPVIPKYATNNAHMFYLICNSFEERQELIDFLKQNDILAVFHYLPLHKSSFYESFHDDRNLPNAIKYADNLVRLPFFYELTEKDLIKIINYVKIFYEKYKLKSF